MTDDEDYDLKPVEAAPKPHRIAKPVVAAPTAVLPPTAPADTDSIKNFRLPLGLLIGGVAIDVIESMLHGHGLMEAIIDVSVGLVITTIVMLAGVLIAAKVRSIDLGPFGAAVFKLAAISVAAPAMETMLGPLVRWFPMIGGFLPPLIAPVFAFAFLGALFDLDESDTWYCLCVMLVIGIGLYFARLYVLGS
jgi:hypothetical protein